MNLPINPDTISDELKAARAQIEKWVKRIDTEGVPGVDQPGAESTLLEFVKEFSGEMLFVSRKLEALSDIVGSEEGGG